MSSMKFTSLRIEGWRQFGHVDISLHPRLTVLTGANGAGKSSLLKIFQRHFGIDSALFSHTILTIRWRVLLPDRAIQRHHS